MPYLGDFLGHLLSEITLARVQSDVEALRVAEIYAGHPLLRHLPVPHFRLPTVNLDVTVAVKQMEEARPGESPRGGFDEQKLRQAFDRLLSTHLRRIGIKPTDKEAADLRSELDRTMTKLAEPPDVAINVKRIADELVEASMKTLSVSAEQPEERANRIRSISEDLKREALIEFLKTRQPPPRLHVLVTAAELREAGPRENLTQLRLTISEEAMEWTVIDSEGKQIDRLVPE